MPPKRETPPVVTRVSYPTKADYEEAKELAKRHGLSLPAMVRFLIKREVNRAKK
jgi:hypothetical protein